MKAINNLSHLHNLKLSHKKAIQNGKLTILWQLLLKSLSTYKSPKNIESHNLVSCICINFFFISSVNRIVFIGHFSALSAASLLTFNLNSVSSPKGFWSRVYHQPTSICNKQLVIRWIDSAKCKKKKILVSGEWIFSLSQTLFSLWKLYMGM